MDLDRRAWLALTSLLLYATGLLWPGVHRTLVEHHHGAETGVHLCVAHVAAQQETAPEDGSTHGSRDLGGDRDGSAPGPQLTHGDADGQLLPCPFDGPQLPSRTAPEPSAPLSWQRVLERPAALPLHAPRVPRLDRVLLAPKGSPPRFA